MNNRDEAELLSGDDGEAEYKNNGVAAVLNNSSGRLFIHFSCRVFWLFLGFLLVIYFYLRILCASILRFWLLEHTTATRSGWLGIATLRLKLTDTSCQKLYRGS